MAILTFLSRTDANHILPQIPMNPSSWRAYIAQYVFPVILFLIPVSFFYPRPNFFNILIALLILSWIIEGNLRSKFRQALKSKFVLLFIGLFLIYLFCISYSENTLIGLTLIERKICLLLFPIVISTIVISENLLRKILFAFIITCFGVTIITIVRMGFYHLISGDPIAITLFRDEFTELSGLEIPYIALYVDFAIILIIYFLWQGWKNDGLALKIIGVLLSIYLLVVNIFLSARMPLLALLVMALISFFYLSFRHGYIAVAVLIITISIIGFTFWKVKFINSRFKEIIQTEWAPPVGVYYNSTNLRIGSLICGMIVLKDHWLLGLGTGGVQRSLNSCYQSNGYSDVMYVDQYNTHNEYLNVWLNTGLLGILIFLFSLIIPLLQSINGKHFLYTLFLGLVIMTFLTECVLERNKGMIFYSFFNSLLAFAYWGNKGVVVK